VVEASGYGSERSNTSVKHSAATFEVDTITLRGHGISQNMVHPAIQELSKEPPIQMNFCGEAKLNGNLEAMFARMPPTSIQYLSSVLGVTENFFSSSKVLARYKDASGAITPANLPPNGCNILLCDHADGEAIAVSRYFQSIFSTKATWLEDQDMTAQDYATVARNGKPSNAIFMFSQNTHMSAVQLSRLGLLIKVHPEMHMVPVVVGVSFDFPDEEYIAQLEGGTLLNLGTNPAQKIIGMAGDEVSFVDMARGLVHAMSFLICFIDVPRLSQKNGQQAVLDILSRATGTGRRTSFSKLPPLKGPADAGIAPDTIEENV